MHIPTPLIALTFTLPASAETFDPTAEIYFKDTNDASLEGNILWDCPDTGPLTREKANVMVCGFKHKGSYLSWRDGPDSGAREIMRFQPFINLRLTGEVNADASWARISGYAVKADAEGRTVAHPLMGDTPVSGCPSDQGQTLTFSQR